MTRGIALVFSIALLALAIATLSNGGASSGFAAATITLIALSFFGFWKQIGALQSMQAELLGLRINDELTVAAILGLEWTLVKGDFESVFETIGDTLGVAWIKNEGPLIVRVFSYGSGTRCIRFYVARNKVKRITIEAIVGRS